VKIGVDVVGGQPNDLDVYSFGWGRYGQLGHGDEKSTMVPRPLDRVSLHGQGIKSLSCGSSCSAALSSRGEVFTWGYGKYGQLGHWDRRNQSLPKRVRMLQRKGIELVAVGKEVGVAVSNEGTIYTWGSGAYGMLGNGAEADVLDATTLPSLHVPEVDGTANHDEDERVEVDSSNNNKETKEATGSERPGSVQEDGRPKGNDATGDNDKGGKDADTTGQGGNNSEAGDGSSTKQQQQQRPAGSQVIPKEKPMEGPRVLRVCVGVACGQLHTLLLDNLGAVYSFGLGKNGRLGHGNEENCKVAKNVSSLIDTIVTSVHCGWMHSVALTSEGRLYTWGCGHDMQLGARSLSSSRDMLSPAWITSFALEDKRGHVRRIAPVVIKSVSCGGKHNLAICESGQVFSWGRNEFGRLGHGGEAHREIPTRILAFEKKVIVQVAAGGYHSLAMDLAGLVYSWGFGAEGRLGHGDSNDHYLPTVVQALASSATHSIHAGAFCSMALVAPEPQRAGRNTGNSLPNSCVIS
jgi:alpha-tubulin suppressor-like RCC1 family protein